MSADWPVRPRFPVPAGVGPLLRRTQAELDAALAELALYRAARESLAAELRAMRVNAVLDAAVIAELRADRDRAIALLRAPLEVMP